MYCKISFLGIFFSKRNKSIPHLFASSSSLSISISVHLCKIIRYLILKTILVTEPPYSNPCEPTPCGPNSHCHEVNGHAVCSCQVDYIGIPPQCRPECVVSSECPQDKACIKQKCTDPCPNTCGENAFCKVVNHNPICSCTRGFTGDPFVRCNRDECKIIVPR